MNEAIERAIQEQRDAANRPCNWLHLTEAERLQLLGGTVPESVKLACYELGDEAFEATLIQNSEKPDLGTQKAARAAKSSGMQRRRGGGELCPVSHPDAELGHPERKARP